MNKTLYKNIIDKPIIKREIKPVYPTSTSMNQRRNIFFHLRQQGFT